MANTSNYEKVVLETVAVSDVGRVRDHNEDAFGYASGDFGSIFIVCDGVGGNQGGSTASKTAVNSIIDHFSKINGEYNFFRESREAMNYANKQILDLASSSRYLSGMSTTAAFLLVCDQLALISHLGDSRVYLFRHKRIYQLTKDHSAIEEIKDKKLGRVSKAETQELKHVITRSLGTNKLLVPEVSETFPIYKNDIFLICSDGLINHVTEKEIKSILSKYSMNDAAQKLVDWANVNGGNDNITIQLVKVASGPPLPKDYFDDNPVFKNDIKSKTLIYSTVAALIGAIGLLVYAAYKLIMR